jgi:hypothetical protein
MSRKLRTRSGAKFFFFAFYQFGTPMKVMTSIEKCLNATFCESHIAKLFSVIFRVKMVDSMKHTKAVALQLGFRICQ